MLRFSIACDKINHMSKKEFLSFCFMTIFAGAAIGFGATGSLLANSLLPDMIGRLTGACLFSMGLVAVVVFEMKLFTGMMAKITDLGVRNLWQLPLCFLGNALGIGLVALLVRYSFMGEAIAMQGAEVIAGKLNAEYSLAKNFCSAVLCGMLITFSVRSAGSASKTGLSATFGVVIPVVVFAFCGFDHSVANMMYFYFLGECSGRVIVYILVTVAGNIIGGALLPLVVLFKEHTKTGETKKTNESETLRETVKEQEENETV